MKRIVIPAALAIAACSTALFAQGTSALKVGVFDDQRVLEETAEGKRLAGKLDAFREKKQAEFLAKRKEVEELQNQLQSQALSLSPEKKSGLEKDLQKKAIEFQQFQEATDKEFQLEASEAQSSFIAKLQTAVTQLGKDEGFSIILVKGAVAYASPSVEVTTAVVDLFNKMYPVTPEAPAAAEGAAKPAAPPEAK